MCVSMIDFPQIYIYIIHLAIITTQNHGYYDEVFPRQMHGQLLLYTYLQIIYVHIYRWFYVLLYVNIYIYTIIFIDLG